MNCLFKLFWKCFKPSCRSGKKLFDFLLVLRCTTRYTLLFAMYSSPPYTTHCKKWCEKVLWQTEWRSLQVSICNLFLHRVQIQFKWERLIRKNTTFGFPGGNCYIKPTVQTNWVIAKCCFREYWQDIERKGFLQLQWRQTLKRQLRQSCWKALRS